MKVLIVSPYMPHPLSGHATGVFMYGLLEHLTRRHEVTLVSFCDQQELALVEDLERLSLEVHAIPREKGLQKNILRTLYLASIRFFQFFYSILLWQPYYVGKYRHARLARLIERLTQETAFDIVQIEFAYMGQYVKHIRSGKTVLHEHDVAYRPAFRRYKKTESAIKKAIMLAEWCRWAYYEPKIARRFNHILCVTDRDRKLLEWLTGTRHISYLPRAVAVPDSPPPYESREPESILFVGSFSHHPNVDAAIWLGEEIFPLVVRQYPRATFYVVGPNPPPALQKIADTQPGIKILGFVDDVVPFLQRCSVFVAPLRYGGGVKVKILHAMAQGIPVVSTKVGIEGIDGIEPHSVPVAESAKPLAGHICALFKDRAHAAVVGRKGWETMQRRYSWEHTIGRLEDIYNKALGLN